MSTKTNVSIIVTAHNEGIFAHKTMLSIFRGTQKLEENNINYEILVHIDNGSDETLEYFKRYKKYSRVKIFYNQFGDLSSSRNFTIQQAKGDYIAITDADDLYSENWLIDFYNCIKGRKDVVARFSYILTFGSRSEIIITDLTHKTPKDEFLYSFDSNIYGSPCMFHKDIYKEFQQRKNDRPFGFEDWQWYLDTLAKGIKHEVVKGTVLFYRRDIFAKTSLLNGQVNYRAVLSKTPFFSFDRLKQQLKKWPISSLDSYINIDDQPKNKISKIKEKIKKGIYLTLVFANNFKLYKLIRHKIKGDNNKVQEIPSDLLNEWKSINQIEKTLYPDDWCVSTVQYYLPNKQIGLGYLKLVDKLTNQPNTLMFVPWLNAGGADKVFINTINELVKEKPDWQVGIIQTEKSDSPWRNKLSKQIDFIRVEDIFSRVDYEKQMDILAMFIIQNDIKRIIIANSTFGYHFVMRYKKLIETIDLKVYVFSFNSVVDKSGRTGGFADELLPTIYSHVYKVITDNSITGKVSIEKHGYIQNKFNISRQFIDNSLIKNSYNIKTNNQLKIMWASRISWQKMPEMVAKIQKKLGDSTVIDIYGKFEEKYNDKFIEKNNLNYIREFNGINDLPTDNYDVFLYTSNADGMPNMLLEIAAKGLPIIAPNVGGISDFIINNKTGILIDDCYDDSAYVKAIEYLRNDKLRSRLIKNAQKLLKEKYNQDQWREGIKEIFDK